MAQGKRGTDQEVVTELQTIHGPSHQQLREEFDTSIGAMAKRHAPSLDEIARELSERFGGGPKGRLTHG